MSICYFLFTVSLLKFIDAQCYVDQEKSFHRGHEYDFRACGDKAPESGFQSCCIGNDTCYGNSICLSSSPYIATSGYYIGGCTDHHYSDPSCSHHCRDLNWADIVYNQSSGLWTCCQKFGSSPDDVDCRNPGNETFYAPPPNDLRVLSAISVLPISSTLSASNTPASSIPSTSSSYSHASLSSTRTSSDSSRTLTPLPSGTSKKLSTRGRIVISVVVPICGCVILAGFFLSYRFCRLEGFFHAAIFCHLKGFSRQPGAMHQATDNQGASGQGTDTYHAHQPWFHGNPQPAEAHGESAIPEMQSCPISEMSATRL